MQGEREGSAGEYWGWGGGRMGWGVEKRPARYRHVLYAFTCCVTMLLKRIYGLVVQELDYLCFNKIEHTRVHCT